MQEPPVMLGRCRLISHHYWVVDGQLETRSVPFRYLWPSELDLMARLAGMRLRERWSDWTREPLHQPQQAARVGLGQDGLAAELLRPC